MKFTLTIPKADVSKTYAHVLEEAVKDSNLKGFRKGKAPKKLVEESIGQDKLYDSVVNHVVPEYYIKEVKKRQLKPITAPKITAKNLKPGTDWELEIEVAQMPEIQLGDYQKYVKDAKATAAAKDAIWVPGKDNGTPASATPADPTATTDKKPAGPDENQTLKVVFDTLLEHISLEVPELLVEQEVSRALSRLLNQVDQLGLTIEQYLSSMNTTSEKIRQEYAKTATESLKLEFILQAVADEQKISVTDKEIDQMIASLTSDQEKKTLNTPEQRANLTAILRKRKTVDYLLKL